MFSIKDRFSFEYEEYIGNIFLTDSLDKHHEKENQGEIWGCLLSDFLFNA